MKNLGICNIADFATQHFMREQLTVSTPEPRQEEG